MTANDNQPNKPTPNMNYKRPMFIAWLFMIVLVGGSTAWASIFNITGAIIATGSVVVQGKPKSIQHLDGGIVKAIHIDIGDRVDADQLLVELDDTSIRANLVIYKTRLSDALVRAERLKAELGGDEAFIAPNELARLLNLGDLTAAVEQQKEFMDARRLTREAQVEQLGEKVEQFGNQIDGVNGLIKEKSTQIAMFKEERASLNILVEKQLAPKSRVMALDRSEADLRGQIAEHKAEVARVLNSISETKISKIQLERQFREEVIDELDQIETRIDEMRQQLDATQKQLSRVSIKSPSAGIVHELSLFTIGGVVQPGQVIMQVIPQTGDHEIELSVATTEIDQLFIGQDAIIRLPAFNQRDTPELRGKVAIISPSSVVDEQSGFSFYRVVAELAPEELSRLGDKKLVSGMPVEAFITREERSVLSFLLKPLTDQMKHAFREE